MPINTRIRHSDQVVDGRIVAAQGYDFIDLLETRSAPSECMTIETESFDTNIQPEVTTETIEMNAGWAQFNDRPPVYLLGSRFTIIFAPRPMPPSKLRLAPTQTPWWIPFSTSVFRDLRSTLKIDGSVIDYIDGLAIRGPTMANLNPGDVLKYDIRTPSIGTMPWTHTALSLSYNPRTRETNVVIFGNWRDNFGANVTRNLYERITASPRTAFHPFHALFPYIYGEFARYTLAMETWDTAAEALSARARRLHEVPAENRDQPIYRQAYNEYSEASKVCYKRAKALEKTMCSWWGLLAYLAQATQNLVAIHNNRPPSTEAEEEWEHSEWRNRQMNTAAEEIVANVDVLVEWLGKDIVSLRERLDRGILAEPEPEPEENYDMEELEELFEASDLDPIGFEV